MIPPPSGTHVPHDIIAQFTRFGYHKFSGGGIFSVPGGTRTGAGVYTGVTGHREEAWRMCGKSGVVLLGICAAALGMGILIAAIFPAGLLLFVTAFLLIACGCACCRRR